MSILDDVIAERDALKLQNEGLTAQAKQLIGDLQKFRGASDSTGGKSVSRADYDKMKPYEQANYVLSGGKVTN